MSVNFDQLKPNQLAKAAIVPQVLDNQWVPRKLLADMIRSRKGLNDNKRTRRKYVKKEWRRALVYGEQVVVNRAYIFNNDIAGEDYLKKSNRNPFKTLLNDKVIIPFLWNEDSPEVKPHFTVREKFWDAWLEVIRDSQPSCVRLDWGDQSDEFKRLSGLFHKYFQNLNRPDTTKYLAESLGISKDKVELFQNRLVHIATYAFQRGQQKDIVRSDIYREFVCDDGADITLGVYSREKPFAAEIKQLADLKYNVNLPDLLGRYALTPEDSLPRNALGDLEEMVRQQIISEANVQEILYALQRLAFAQVLSGEYLKSLGVLTLPEVISIRATDEWQEYKNAIHELLDDPLNFSESSKKVYREFGKLNKAITNIHTASIVSRWEPWVKLMISVGTKAIELWIDPVNPGQKFLTYAAQGAATTGFTPILMRLTVTAIKRGNADLDLSLDFVRGTVTNGNAAFAELVGQLRYTPGIKVLEKSISEVLDSNQSFPEEKKG